MEMQSSTGQHTLAIVSSDEKYFTRKECFCTIFYQINNLLSQSNGNIVYETKSKKKFRLEILLGADVKFLLCLVWMPKMLIVRVCIVNLKRKTSQICLNLKNLSWSKEIVRSNQEMKLFCSKSNFGCIHPPLLNIELSHVLIDELHLLMRICDVLLRNLIEESILIIKTALEKRHKHKIVLMN